MKKNLCVAIGGGLIGVSLLPLPSAMAAAGPGVGVEEVVVTAQKRQERLQDVPLSITALTGAKLEQSGSEEFVNYARTVPSLSFIDRGPGRNKITIRGISTGVDQNSQSPVGIYFDEMPVSSPSNEPDLKLFDIERVEVLRGPQGTLYGAGSMGGTIKIITNKPNLTEVEGKIQGGISSTRHGGENYKADGMLNLPLVKDKLALRLVGYYRDESGYIDNVELHRNNVNSDKTYGGRMAIKAVVSDKFNILASAFFQHTKVGGSQEITLGLGDLNQDRAVPEIRHDNFEQYNLTLKYDLGGAELLSSTSYYNRRADQVQDITAFVNAGAPVSLFTGFPTKRLSEEIRLTSAPGGAFEYIVGLFYLHTRDKLVQSAPFGDPVLFDLLDSDINRRNEQYAAFGEISYNITDKLKATVGLRWFTVTQSFDLNSSGPIVGGQRVDSGHSKNSRVNPKFHLAYKASSNILFYTQAAQGFRIGGPNNTLPPDPVTGQTAPTQYGPDSLWNYEVGMKTELLDKRLTFNTSVFYIDWTNIQVNIPRIDGFSYIGNAGKASSRGIEVELSARPVPAFEISGGFSYVDAKLDKDAPDLNGLKGDRIPTVPKITFNLSGRYQAPLFGAIDGFAEAGLQHVGNSYNGFNTATADLQRAYDLVNIRAGLMSKGWQITFYANNLFDKRADLYVDTTLGDTRANVNRPRTLGVSMSYGF